MSHGKPIAVATLEDRLRRLAELSVARACGFSGLAILCLMVGFSFEPTIALKAGGYGALLVMATLLLAAQGAERKRFNRTELWLMLDERDRPPAALAQAMVTRARRATFLRFAYYHALIAAGLLATTLLLGATG